MLLLKDVPRALYRGQTVSVPRHPAEAPPEYNKLKIRATRLSCADCRLY